MLVREMVPGLPGGKMAASKTMVSADEAPGGSTLEQPRGGAREGGAKDEQGQGETLLSFFLQNANVRGTMRHCDRTLRANGHGAAHRSVRQNEKGVVLVERRHVRDVGPAGEVALQAAGDVTIGGRVATAGAGESVARRCAVGAGPAGVVPAHSPLEGAG